jgi:ankyrin repeat protein
MPRMEISRTHPSISLLYLAALKGHVELCCMLVEAGAVVEARDDKQSTPLHWAAQQGHVELCRMLVEAGAAVEARSVKRSWEQGQRSRQGVSTSSRLSISLRTWDVKFSLRQGSVRGKG